MSPIAFLHIGKCGGSTLCKRFRLHGVDFKEFHLSRPKNNSSFDPASKIITYVRHPVSRFVSAFAMAKSVTAFSLERIKINKLNLSNCPAPGKIKSKINRGYYFSPRYDKYLGYFGSANDLAESLYSDDLGLRHKARVLMNLPQEHLFKGIGWYLHNGAFIENSIGNFLFVGRVEKFEDDFDLLMSKLGLPIPERASQSRVVLRKANSHRIPLTSEAKANIIRWYEPTDYSALISLEHHGLISRETLDEYYS